MQNLVAEKRSLGDEMEFSAEGTCQGVREPRLTRPEMLPAWSIQPPNHFGRGKACEKKHDKSVPKLHTATKVQRPALKELAKQGPAKLR